MRKLGGSPQIWYNDYTAPGREQKQSTISVVTTPKQQSNSGLSFVTPQRVSIISMGVPNFPINLQTKLILMALISPNYIITIIIYAPFVRLVRKFFQRNKPTGK